MCRGRQKRFRDIPLIHVFPSYPSDTCTHNAQIHPRRDNAVIISPRNRQRSCSVLRETGICKEQICLLRSLPLSAHGVGACIFTEHFVLVQEARLRSRTTQLP